MSFVRVAGWRCTYPAYNPQKAKNPAEAGFFKKLKLTDKAASFDCTSGNYSAEVVLWRRLYLTLCDR